MGSSRKEDVSSVPPSSPRSNPVTAQTVFVFLSLLNLPLTGKPAVSPRHWVLLSLTLSIPVPKWMPSVQGNGKLPRAKTHH
ncbi:Hypothetical predicted protein [Scomber scombrus]|uniref:Uncharacterized protein n=1 Tax=Scomber scombrus TaxID=13677 RepID=A0AAV1P6W8_SCOSC